MSKTKTKTIEEQFADFLTARIADLKGSLEQWANRLAREPADTLGWGSNLFRDAARFEVYSRVRDALTGKASKATVESIREHALKLALGHIRHLPSSTSATHNHVELCRGSAWAEVVEIINMRFRSAASDASDASDRMKP